MHRQSKGPSIKDVTTLEGGRGGLKNLGNGAVMTFFGEVTELRTVKGEGRVKKLGKSADVLYGRPPSPSLALLPSQP